MDVGAAASAGAVLVVGWGLALAAIRAFYTPLPRPTNLTTWGYWIARCIVWGYFLACAVVGTGVVVSAVCSGPGPHTFANLLRIFLLSAAFWPWFVLYLVACSVFKVCLG